ncbi:MAG: beta-mannosidase [Flavobacteriales bacterium]
MYKYLFILLVFFSSCKKEESIVSQEITGWKFEYNGNWHKAEVPGNNFTDLLNHHFIADPFYGTNEDSIQWVSEKDWHYKSRFSVTKNTLKNKKQYLVFNGLDTYAKVYLNDSLILVADNMFRKWEADVKGILKKENELRILFEPVSEKEKEKQTVLGYSLPGGDRVFTRKAGFHYGWDWGAKITPSGIWRKVELKIWDACIINDIYVTQDNLTDSLANLMVSIKIESSTAKTITVKVHNNILEDFKLKKGDNSLSLNIQILSPELWWPNGYGNQKLYDISVCIVDENGILDSRIKKIGLRKIELITKQDSLGKTFYFKVNNRPIFMKGANYIPQDNLQNRVTKNHYRNLLNDVKTANMNMLRVWGGGIYEEDIFYDLCDSLGILVWQDFMFACAMYPSDSLFLKNVKQEAIDNVKRLRHHPSIALWCGNNEISEGWHRWGWQDSYTEKQKVEIWSGYQKVFQEILPQVVEMHSQFAYWESSPKFGRGNPKHQFEGDAHYWGVWHDTEPFENLERKVPRFMSEFGFQSFPEMSTIATFSDSTDWSLNSDVIKSHQKHPRGNVLIKEYMQREYNIPEKFKKFIYASQVLQANGMRIGLEAHRRSQPYCMGTLYWQLNDCWPVASWSSRDYFGNWKALHYTAQDVFSPVSLSLEKTENNNFNIWVISDTTNCTDTLLINTYSLKGKILSSSKQFLKIQAKSQLIDSIPFCKDDEFIICKLKQQNVESKVGFTKAIKNYDFPKPNIQYQYIGGQLKLSTNTPAFQIYLHGIKGNFSDNFFTLLPGEEKVLEIGDLEFNPNNLLIWSLYDLNKN